jgi:PAS domain S-box-containing protein
MAAEPACSIHPQAAVDPHEESVEVLGALLDRVAFVIITLGALATVASALRVTSQGWHPNVVLNLPVYPGFMVVVLLRRRLGPRLAFWLLIGLAIMLAAADYSTLGLVTISPLMLAVACVVVAMMSGLRAGFAVLLATAIGVATVGALIVSGALPEAVLDSEYSTSPQSWALHILAYLLHSSILLVVVSSVMGRFGNLLSRISTQSSQLTEREKLYRHLAENMRDGLFMLDMDLAITYTSPSAIRLFGYSAEEMKRNGLAPLLTPESLRDAQEAFRDYSARALEGPVEIPPMEFEFVRSDGSRFWGEMRGTFVRDENGVPTGLQGTVMDISDLKQAATEREELEAKLRQAEKLQAIGQLAGGVAHDFNNQLAGVIGYADLLRYNASLDSEAREYIDHIMTSAQRAGELTEKLLAFARRGQYRRVPVDLHEMIKEAISILERSIDKTIRIVRRFEADNATIAGDPSQIVNAILNLALNARDAMPEGGELVFETCLAPPAGKDGGRRVLAIVSDTGTGIQDSELERIFEPFYTTKDHGRGTGMGLAAVYGTVMGHGGTIEVDSTPGRGSRFILSFPLTSAPAIETSVADAPRDMPGEGRILLVEDERMVRTAITAMLERQGFAVEACPDGPSAVQVYTRGGLAFDAVVLDMVLPGMSGTDVARAIRSANPNSKLLIVSGYSADGAVNKLLASGGAAFLKKPFRSNELVRALDELLRNREAPA